MSQPDFIAIVHVPVFASNPAEAKQRVEASLNSGPYTHTTVQFEVVQIVRTHELGVVDERRNQPIEDLSHRVSEA